ncbi:hypothetical protein B9Z19DRAFT_256952 [Tuber borchii]|uniref:Uncharacterized protein n=1 Tax=Tuber borchii TaxID=42251 RepID=A0A2T6ZLH1_TUBBO|nr:hypothetical protein B9Z19DRAFT_256952 [Tuber borchii]
MCCGFSGQSGHGTPCRKPQNTMLVVQGLSESQLKSWQSLLCDLLQRLGQTFRQPPVLYSYSILIGRDKLLSLNYPTPLFTFPFRKVNVGQNTTTTLTISPLPNFWGFIGLGFYHLGITHHATLTLRACLYCELWFTTPSPSLVGISPMGLGDTSPLPPPFRGGCTLSKTPTSNYAVGWISTLGVRLARASFSY